MPHAAHRGEALLPTAQWALALRRPRGVRAGKLRKSRNVQGITGVSSLRASDIDARISIRARFAFSVASMFCRRTLRE